MDHSNSREIVVGDWVEVKSASVLYRGETLSVFGQVVVVTGTLIAIKQNIPGPGGLSTAFVPYYKSQVKIIEPSEEQIQEWVMVHLLEK